MSILNGSNKALYAGIAAREIRQAGGENTHELRINGLTAVIESEESYVMLCYDIPTHKNREVPNPSKTLWSHGFRINLSCWVLPASELDHPVLMDLFASFKTHKIRTHVIEYADSQVGKVREIAAEKLREELVRAHTSLIERIGAANDALRAAEQALDATDHTVGLAREKRTKQLKAIIRDAGDALDAAISCAELFDQNDRVADLLKGLRLAIASQRAALKGATLFPVA